MKQVKARVLKKEERFCDKVNKSQGRFRIIKGLFSKTETFILQKRTRLLWYKGWKTIEVESSREKIYERWFEYQKK